MNLAEASIETNPRFRAACNVPKLNLHNIPERTLNTVCKRRYLVTPIQPNTRGKDDL